MNHPKPSLVLSCFLLGVGLVLGSIYKSTFVNDTALTSVVVSSNRKDTDHNQPQSFDDKGQKPKYLEIQPSKTQKEQPVQNLLASISVSDDEYQEQLYFNAKPEAFLKLVDQLAKIEDQEIQQRGLELIERATYQHFEITDRIFEKIRAGENRDFWLNIAYKINGINAENTRYLAQLTSQTYDPELRSKLVRAIGRQLPVLTKLNHTERLAVDSAIQRALSDPEPKVRVSAVGALRRYPTDNIDETLLALIKDKNRQVRQAASTVVQQLSPKNAEIANSFLEEARNKSLPLLERNDAFRNYILLIPRTRNQQQVEALEREIRLEYESLDETEILKLIQNQEKNQFEWTHYF